MSVNKRFRQSGAAMVEMALTLALFLAIVFAIFEFALAYFKWDRAAEGARQGLRQAIVSSPATGSALALTCPGGQVVVQCTTADCQPILNSIQRVAPFVQGSQVSVIYACSDAGNPARPAALAIPEITVEVSGLVYTFAVPGIIGLGTTMQLPVIRVSRTGEDLYTQ